MRICHAWEIGHTYYKYPCREQYTLGLLLAVLRLGMHIVDIIDDIDCALGP